MQQEDFWRLNIDNQCKFQYNSCRATDFIFVVVKLNKNKIFIYNFSKDANMMTPITNIYQLGNEINFDDFEKKQYFEHICNLIPNKKAEKLDIEVIDEEKCNERGVVYAFVIRNKIFKIGQSTDNIKKRIQSYNSGKAEYRTNGTNSITNYFVLQSFLNLNEIVRVYAYFPPKPTYDIFEQTCCCDSYPPSKRAENIILTDLIKNHNKKPIGCTQI